jgi:hypothetical protein
MYQLIHKKTKESHLCEKTYISGIVHYVNKDLEIIACVEPDKGYPCIIDEVAVKTEQFSICYPASLKDREQQFLEIGFYNGYQQAHFISPFTLEDMVNFANWIADSTKHGYAKQLHEAMLRYKVKSVEELIRIWQSQQTKTLYYE